MPTSPKQNLHGQLAPSQESIWPGPRTRLHYSLRDMSSQQANFYEQVYTVVRRIPRGRVTSYGRVAQMLGRPNAARAVGYALASLRDKKDAPDYADIPWQRVINSQGRISIASPEHTPNRQAELLRAEGVAVSDNLRVDMNIYLWEGLHLVEIDDILSREINHSDPLL